jgi:hypothetical protein
MRIGTEQAGGPSNADGLPGTGFNLGEVVMATLGLA